MSALALAFIISLSSGVWIYYKFAKRTGSGNLKPAIIGGAIVAVIIFIISFLTLSTFLK